MGKGQAVKRRRKLFERSHESNLLKAQVRPGKALPFAKLPDAPKEKEVEKVPASLKKLMMLQAASKKQEAQKAARKEAAAYKADQPSAAAGEGHAQGSIQHLQHPNQQAAQGKPARHSAMDARQPAPQVENTDAPSDPPGSQQPTKKRKLQDSAIAVVEERIYKANAFEVTKKKKLKDSKKQFLERKKQQKKSKGRGGSDLNSVATPAELKLMEQQAATTARFGEVADAPLKVQLKRKHWVSKGGDGDGTSTEGVAASNDTGSRASHRLTKIFQSQLAAAEQRLAAGTSQAPGTGRQKQPHQSKQSAGKVKPGQPMSLLQQAQAHKAAVEREKLRQSVVQAYRNSKKGSAAGQGEGQEGKANMKSLAKLVERGMAQQAEAARIR